MDIVIAKGKKKDKIAHAATGGVAFDASLPTIVFLHGAGMDHTVWALQTRYFAYNGFAVLAVDLPGHGQSSGPALKTIGGIADWVWRMLDAVGVMRAALVGHSMGALIALEAAGRAPDRTTGLALVGASPAMPVNDVLLDATRDDPALASRMIVSWAYGGRSQIGGMRAPGLWMTGGGLHLLARAPKGALHKDFSACAAYQDGLDAAAKVTCPTLVISGAEDRMTPPRTAQPLLDIIGDARGTVIPDCGHILMAEKPDETLDALKAFF
jgi:pimeloyl-ACP methyl ester carboxylesterase